MNKNGIALITLCITIAILVIVAGVLVYTGSNIVSSAKLQTLNTNMLLIQAKVKTISEKDTFNGGDGSLLVGEPMDSAEYAGIIQNLKKNNVILDGEIFYIWDKEILEQQGLNKVELPEGIIYLVNYDTDEVIYSAGYKHTDSNMYYKLSVTKDLTVNE